MVEDLLARAREQADRSEKSVRASAWMRIARVEMSLDRNLAHESFKLGLEAAKQLSGESRGHLLQQARTLAASMDPDLLGDIPMSDHSRAPFETDMLAATMTAHGHIQAAFAYVMHCEDSAFPYVGLVNLILQLEKEEDRVTLLRRAIRAWRSSQIDQPFDPFQRRDHFVRIFQAQWKLLPEDEAREVVREIVRYTLEQPDRATSSTYEEGLVIASTREDALFGILHVVRRLDGPLAESLIAGHSQLAVAIRRFPNGLESIREEAEERRKQASGGTCGGGVMMAGSAEDMPYLRALMQASQDGDFGPAMEHAIEKYREDCDAEGMNEASKEFWPSTSRFRSVLYSAGKKLGESASIYLDQVPDDDLRLFALIEFAAALAGLPELRTTMHIRSNDGMPCLKGPAMRQSPAQHAGSH